MLQSLGVALISLGGPLHLWSAFRFAPEGHRRSELWRSYHTVEFSSWTRELEFSF